MRLFSFVALSLITFSANAQGIFDGLFGNDRLNQYTGIFQAPRGQRSMLNANRWGNSAPAEYQACKAHYDTWFADGVLDVSLIMGYHDVPNRAPRDPNDFAIVRNMLRRSCNEVSGGVCGFKWVPNELPDNITVLEKTIQYGGRPVKIRFTLGYSAASDDDHANLGRDGVMSQQQAQLSQDAETQYFGGIRTGSCEVCGYLGHARDGGGPDFRPVPYAWRLRGGDVNYAKYKENRTNYRRLLESLLYAPQQSRQLIAVMGCSSLDHFYQKKICAVEAPGCQKISLSDFAGIKGFILADLLSWPQNRDQYLGLLLDGVLGLKCRSAFERNLPTLLNLPRKEDYKILGSFLN